MEGTGDVSQSGQVDSLFYLLWLRNKQQQRCPHVNIPHTVLFRFQQPAAWYFTSAQDGSLKRKHRHNLTPSHVIDVFEKATARNISGIAATYLYTEVRNGEPVTTAEFLDMEGVRSLFTRLNRPANACLQQFIEPSGGKNVMIRAEWSPVVRFRLLLFRNDIIGFFDGSANECAFAR